MTSDDALYKFRLRVFALASELGNVHAACRAMGVHPSTYYRWRRRALRYGLDILRPRERRAPKTSNATPARAASGPARAPHRGLPPWSGRPDGLFYVGRLQGTQRAVWPYTAIDVASSYGWAELHPGPVRHPSSRWTSALAEKVASDLAARGWRLETITTDHGSEFKGAFTPTLATLGAHHRRIVAGRPQSNGCVERLHETILEECWKPAFARHLLPGLTGLREELRRYLRYYNTDRAHTGRLTRGRTPDEVFGAAKMFSRLREEASPSLG